MKRLFKSKKGMSLIEVMVALTILGLLTIPVMTAFMNTQIYARKVDKETEISSITRTVKQIVANGLIENLELIDIGGIAVNQFDGDPSDSDYDSYMDFINYGIAHESDPDPITTPYLQILEGSSLSANSKYQFTISYHHKDFYNAKYPDVYNLLITIIEKGSSKVANKIKIAVKI